MAVTTIHPVDVTVGSAIKYIQDEEKTDYGRLVYGHNCDPYFADVEMELTRKQFGKGTGKKNDKHRAFHLVQSFEKNEKLTDELAHQIGIELAEKMFPNFEVVVTTHNNTEHLHNHFIINAVSFVDGKKYYDCDKTKQEIRTISDSLCEKYHLRVLEKSKTFQRNIAKERNENTKLKVTDYRNTESYVSWKQDNYSQKDVIANDIDISISKSRNFEEFISNMELLGYDVKHENVKHIAFKAPGAERYRRGYVIGEDYTKERILERIKEFKLEQNLEFEQNVEYEAEAYNEINPIMDEADTILEEHKNDKWSQNENYNSLANVLRNSNRELKNLYKEKSGFVYDRNSDLRYKEQEILNRITNTIKNMHTMTEQNITSIDMLSEKISEQKSRIDDMAISLDKIKSMIDNRIKIVEVFEKYQTLLHDKENGILSEEQQKEFANVSNYVQSVEMDLGKQNKYIEETKYAVAELSNLEKQYNDAAELYTSLKLLQEALDEIPEVVHQKDLDQERDEREKSIEEH